MGQPHESFQSIQQKEIQLQHFSSVLLLLLLLRAWIWRRRWRWIWGRRSFSISSHLYNKRSK